MRINEKNEFSKESNRVMMLFGQMKIVWYWHMVATLILKILWAAHGNGDGNIPNKVPINATFCLHY